MSGRISTHMSTIFLALWPYTSSFSSRGSLGIAKRIFNASFCGLLNQLETSQLCRTNIKIQHRYHEDLSITLFIVVLDPSINTKVCAIFFSVTHLASLGEKFSTSLPVSTNITPTLSPPSAFDYVALLSYNSHGKRHCNNGGFSHIGQGSGQGRDV